MLQSSVQQTYNLQIIHRIKTETTHDQVHMVCAFGILAFLQHSCLLKAGLEHSRSNLVFKQPRLRDNFIFGMLNCIWTYLAWCSSKITKKSETIGSKFESLNTAGIVFRISSALMINPQPTTNFIYDFATLITFFVINFLLLTLRCYQEVSIRHYHFFAAINLVFVKFWSSSAWNEFTRMYPESCPILSYYTTPVI